MTNLRDEARWLIGEISEAKRLAKAVGKPQLANSAIEAGRIEEYDADGSLMQIVGEQHDGTHTPVTVNGPVPPEPSAPAITAGIGSVEGRWSGKFASDALSPMDLSHVALHASRTEVFTPSNETQLATITGELGDVAVVLLDSGEWTFGLVAVSKAGKWSGLSETVTIDVPDFPSPVDIQDELIRFDEVTGGLITEAGNLGNRLDQAEEDLTAHEGRLGTAEQRVSEAFVQIGAADGKADAAAGLASAAQTKADTAAQAAADAAGIANGKGKVLVQSTAPGAADRNAFTLWIDTTGGANTPKRWTTGTTWVAVTDKAATDAAAAAAQAAQAAATAQAAAGSAQTTANNALTMAGTKGKVFYSESAPSGTGTAQGDLWRRIDESKNVIGEWYWSGSAWVSSQITTSAIANLDVGKLTVGTGVIADLVAQKIAASTAAFQTVDVKNLFVTTGTMTEAVINKLWADVVMSRKITTQMLAVGSFDNIFSEPEFTDNGNSWSNRTAFPVVTGAGESGNPAIVHTLDATNKDMYNLPLRRNLEPGASYRIRARVWSSSPIPVGGFWSLNQSFTAANVSSWVRSELSVIVPGQTWTWVDFQIQIPPTSHVINLGFSSRSIHATGELRIDRVSATRMSGGELVVDGSIKAKHADLEDFAANTGFIADLTARIVKSDMFVGKEFQGGTFTGSVFQTSGIADVGLKLNGSGLRVYGPEGGEPVTEIRADGGTVYSITDPATGDTLATMGADGGIAGQALDIAQDPVFMGSPLLGDLASWESPSDLEHTGILDPIPRGIVGFVDVNVSGRTTTYEVELGEFSYEHDVRRTYRITVEPLTIYAAKESFANLLIRRTIDGSAPNMDSQILRSITSRDRSSGTVSSAQVFSGSFYHIASTSHTARLLISAQISGDASTSLSIINDPIRGTLRVWVEDIGPHSSSTGMPRSGNRSGAAAPLPPAPTTPTKKNYTKTYEATGWRSYKSDGSTYNYQTSRMYQGNSPAVGTLRSNAVFPSMISDLSGATITSVEAHFYFDHWYYPQGGTARIHLHKDTGGVDSTIAAQTYAVQSGNWKPGSGRWVKIPSQFWNGFKNGDYTGVGLGGTTTAQYGYARGSSTRIRIKYTK